MRAGLVHEHTHPHASRIIILKEINVNQCYNLKISINTVETRI